MACCECFVRGRRGRKGKFENVKRKDVKERERSQTSHRVVANLPPQNKQSSSCGEKCVRQDVGDHAFLLQHFR